MTDVQSRHCPSCSPAADPQVHRRLETLRATVEAHAHREWEHQWSVGRGALDVRRLVKDE